MSLEALNCISQIVAFVGILASFTAVYRQVRQANVNAKATLTQSTWLQIGSMQMSLFGTPERAELMHRALPASVPLSDVEKARMERASAILFGLNEAARNLHKRGLIEETAFNSGLAALKRYLRSQIV